MSPKEWALIYHHMKWFLFFMVSRVRPNWLLSGTWKIAVCDVIKSTVDKSWLCQPFPIMWILHQSIRFWQQALKTAVNYAVFWGRVGVVFFCFFFHLRFVDE